MTDSQPHKDAPILGFTAEALAQTYGGPLRRYFLRRGVSATDADDHVQEVFVRVLKRGQTLHIENPQGYVFQAAANLLKDNARKSITRSERLHDSYDADMMGSDRPMQDRILLGREELARVKAAILNMPERTRSVFILSRLEGLKYKEIADVLGVSVSSIEKHMMRALRCIGKTRDDT